MCLSHFHLMLLGLAGGYLIITDGADSAYNSIVFLNCQFKGFVYLQPQLIVAMSKPSTLKDTQVLREFIEGHL